MKIRFNYFWIKDSWLNGQPCKLQTLAEKQMTVFISLCCWHFGIFFSKLCWYLFKDIETSCGWLVRWIVWWEVDERCVYVALLTREKSFVLTTLNEPIYYSSGTIKLLPTQSENGCQENNTVVSDLLLWCWLGNQVQYKYNCFVFTNGSREEKVARSKTNWNFAICRTFLLLNYSTDLRTVKQNRGHSLLFFILGFCHYVVHHHFLVIFPLQNQILRERSAYLQGIVEKALFPSEGS